ncbi:unnamed protein product [Lactuca virosa]|uniref:Uncharacterized protein n=1 Tax=Lactuca virosa TaxID=75947 RepID=A0AAU9PA47_9ASTR|nr:unnamed protein product [Lactuca virosa]
MDTLYSNAMNNNYINTYNHHSVHPPQNRRNFDPTTVGAGSDKPDHYDSVLKYLNQMLMEEDDLQEKPCMYNECLALQVEAAEKSLYDILVNKNPEEQQPFDTYQYCRESPPEYSTGTTSSDDSSSNFSHHSRKRSPVQEEEREAKLATISELESDQPEEDLLLYDPEPQRIKLAL